MTFGICREEEGTEECDAEEGKCLARRDEQEEFDDEEEEWE